MKTELKKTYFFKGSGQGREWAKTELSALVKAKDVFSAQKTFVKKMRKEGIGNIFIVDIKIIE